MSFFLGLDLGQANDPTAISIVERIGTDSPARPAPGFGISAYPTQEELDAHRLGGASATTAELHLRHLERVKLGTSYPAVVSYVADLLAAPQLRGVTELVVDATGVGAPVVDMLAALDPVAITITSGIEAAGEGRRWRVPKRDLVVGVQVALQSERLKHPKKMRHLDDFRRELFAFQAKISDSTGHASFNAREGEHDDLVLAVALAVWRAQHQPASWFI